VGCQSEKCWPSQEAAEARGGTEEADASRTTRPRTLPTPTPAPTPREASGRLKAKVKREPEEVQGPLARGAEVGERAST
jgi:hypothetical protein